METKEYFEVLKAISDESRFKIINTLLCHDLCVGGLAQQLGITKPAVSQHLQVLRKVGLVRGEKRGYFTHYTVDRQLLKSVGEALVATASKESVGKCERHDTNKCECNNLTTIKIK